MKGVNREGHTATISAVEYLEYCELKSADNDYTDELRKAKRDFHYETEKLKSDKSVSVDIRYNCAAIRGGRPETEYHVSVSKDCIKDAEILENCINNVLAPVFEENNHLKKSLKAFTNVEEMYDNEEKYAPPTNNIGSGTYAIISTVVNLLLIAYIISERLV